MRRPPRSGNASSGNQPGPAAPAGDAAARTLAVAGIDDHADPVQAWRRLQGCRATLIDLYQLAAASQGMTARRTLQISLTTTEWACTDHGVAATIGAWRLSWREFPLMETRTPRRCSSWPEMVFPPISRAA